MPDRGDDLTKSRRDKLDRLRARGINPFPPRSHRTHTTAEAAALLPPADSPGAEGAKTAPVAVAGRITATRLMGKAAFLDIRDGVGRLQLHFRKDTLGDSFDLLRDLDLGDFIQAGGPLFRTRTGEPTVAVESFSLLTKALRPPPEKFHGLQDVEKRYRQRYLDLISNPDVKAAFHKRAAIIRAIRRFFDERGFLEVDTPVLVPVAAGALARPFVTHHNALDQTLYLRIATELYLKRLLVGGFDKVYEVGRVFRNEGLDQDHNPEFTLLESYEAYADYRHVMKFVEQLVSTVAKTVNGSTRTTREGNEIELAPPWRRLGLHDAIREASGIDIDHYPDAESLYQKIRDLGVEANRRESRARLIDKLVSAFVEPKLIQPTFLVDYPVEMSTLAKPKPEDPRYAERFEAFAAGMEIANAYSELNDPDLQREHMLAQERMRAALGDEEVERLDEDFLTALEHGMPPTGGLGIGIDRLVMLLASQPTIRDVLLFPQMRTQKGAQGTPGAEEKQGM